MCTSSIIHPTVAVIVEFAELHLHVVDTLFAPFCGMAILLTLSGPYPCISLVRLSNRDISILNIPPPPPIKRIKMKFGVALFATINLVSGTDAFSSGVKQSARVASVSLQEKIAEELAIPCEEECALESFPNLPPSVHPGVVTGQAMVDLLNHAKEKGKSS